MPTAPFATFNLGFDFLSKNNFEFNPPKYKKPGKKPIKKMVYNFSECNCIISVIDILDFVVISSKSIPNSMS